MDREKEEVEVMMLPEADMLELIRIAVFRARSEKGIIPTPGVKSEGSCFGYPGGEFGNLFWSQLVYTSENTGDWGSLRFPEILEGVYEYITAYLT